MGCTHEGRNNDNCAVGLVRRILKVRVREGLAGRMTEREKGADGNRSLSSCYKPSDRVVNGTDAVERKVSKKCMV